MKPMKNDADLLPDYDAMVQAGDRFFADQKPVAADDDIFSWPDVEEDDGWDENGEDPDLVDEDEEQEQEQEDDVTKAINSPADTTSPVTAAPDIRAAVHNDLQPLRDAVAMLMRPDATPPDWEAITDDVLATGNVTEALLGEIAESFLTELMGRDAAIALLKEAMLPDPPSH